MMASEPDVSILIAAYRAEATLERAVRSALIQTGCTTEVIVIDDASPDGTLALARRLAAGDARIRVIAAPQNRGPAAARNLGLAAARGRFVAVLDSDDFMDPLRLRNLLDLALAGPWDLLADDLFKTPAGQEDGTRQRLLGVGAGCHRLNLAEFVTGNVTDSRNPRGEMGFIKPLMSRYFLQLHDLCYDEDMRLGEDYALYATALAMGARFGLTGAAGYVAVMRPGSLSGRHDTAALAALVRADNRLLAHPGLTAEERRALRRHRIDSMKRWAWMRLIDAVKARDPTEALRCFHAPPAVALHLLARLSEQAVLRTGRRLGWQGRA